MMRWGKKKASFPSSHSSLITHVFPSSWLSKFKQRKKCSDHRSARVKAKGQIELPSRIPSPGISLKDGRFYSGDDDFYWRLSFGEEGAEKTVGSTAGRNSVSLDLHDDNPVPVPISYCRCSSSEDTSMDESRSKNMVPGLRQTRIKQLKAGFRFPLENYAMRREKEKEGAESKKVRRKVQICSKPLEEKHAKRVHHKGEAMTSKAAEKVVFEVQPETVIRTREDFCQSRASNSWKQQSFSFPHSKLRPIEEESECTLEAKRIEETYVDEEKNDPTLPWEKLEDIKVTETSPRNKQQRRSVYIKRNCQKKRRKLTCRIKSYSPRTAVKIECKIKALEDMKKARMTKMKMNERANADIPKKSAVKNTTKEKALTGTTYFDSFAVIKSSFNPRKDFRDSMMEMIIEKEIERPEELEELLASYLTLNYDEHHDLIVKVFREVWSELNELYFASKSQNDHYSYDW